MGVLFAEDVSRRWRMKTFAVQVENGREGRDGKPSVGPVYRNFLAKSGFPPMDSNLNTAWDNLRISSEKYPGNRMLGWREFVGGKLGPYKWKTYREVYEEILHIGSALQASGAQPGSRVGIYGSNCPQWIVAMELLNPDCRSAKRLKLMVCFTSPTEEQKDKAADIGIKPYSWDEFLHMGKENPSEVFPPQPLDICTIMYTSGTSGDPKGVVLTHENVTTIVRGVDIFMEQFEDKMTVDDVYLSFLPLAHILDRIIEEYFFHKGASVGYYHGDMNALREDLMELKPTLFAGVPRVFERVHEGQGKFVGELLARAISFFTNLTELTYPVKHILISGIKKAVQELNPIRRRIFGVLYKYKLSWMNSGYKHREASPLADLLAFRKVKARLGGRVRLIISGGAPLSTEVEEFLRVTSCAFLTQGYETCGLTSIGFPDEMSMIGTVGAVSVYSELRLEEVPEMGYDPFGDPPRGEICVRGKTIFAGYHKNPELTLESIRDGWFHTGDIGEMLPNGVLKIIDRKKNLVKLSQGEYVAVEYLEKVYGTADIVMKIFGSMETALSRLLVAVVQYHMKRTHKKWADLQCLICYIVMSSLSLRLQQSPISKLRGFEHIKGVILEARLFEAEQDLVTPTLKKRRDKMLKHYQAKIDELYANFG
uniref:AMP-dependent synthetase/ligase domain-containing protein n=1 Tax=Vitis vinifera TaxID=29760 RepID=A5BYW2_VITVI|nr:hypothetical protein VITISV_005263 [Vitis vinifera]